MSGARALWRVLADDFRRHESRLSNSAFWAVALYHFGRWSLGLRGVPRWLTSRIYGALFGALEFLTDNSLHREVVCGERLHLVHGGNIRIHPRVVIGDRCGIMHDVTLGTNMDREGVPVLGDDVFIGAGAKILGGVRIGDRARIAANSLVLSDVPPGATAVGVPARIILCTGRLGARKTADADVSARP